MFGQFRKIPRTILRFQVGCELFEKREKYGNVGIAPPIVLVPPNGADVRRQSALRLV